MMPLQKQLELTRLRLAYFWHGPRLLGLAGTGLLCYLLIFVVFGKADMSWLVRERSAVAAHLHWPDLPRFASWRETAPDGRPETVYTVPSRQLTPQELAQLEATNAAPPSAPKN